MLTSLNFLGQVQITTSTSKDINHINLESKKPTKKTGEDIQAGDIVYKLGKDYLVLDNNRHIGDHSINKLDLLEIREVIHEPYRDGSPFEVKGKLNILA